jgi:hypothetical protein
LEPYPTVIEEEFGPGSKRLEDLGVRERRTVFIARLATKIEMEACAGGEFDTTLGESSKPEFWSLQVGKDADRPACHALNPPDRFKSGAMIFSRAMAEIEPEYVDASLEECGDPFRGGTCWAQRRNDLGATPAPHFDHSLCLSQFA